MDSIGASLQERWDAEFVAHAARSVEAVTLDELDPHHHWGRPVSSENVATASEEERRKAFFQDAESWHRGVLLRHAKLSVVVHGEIVGFSEAAVVHRFEEKSDRHCRICFGQEGELLDACACRGSMRYICEECLMREWRSRGSELKDLNSLRCRLCGQSFTGHAAELLGRGLSDEVKKRQDSASEESSAEQASRHLSNVAAATALWQQGKFADAAKLFRQAIAGLEAVKGPEDATTLSARHNLSLVLLAQGQVAEAESHVTCAKAGFQKLYGAEHALALKAAHNEAMIAQARGKTKEAIQMYTWTHEARTRVLGENHLDTLKTAVNLGLSLMRSNQPAAAEARLRGSIGCLERVVGRKHPLTLTAFQNLSLALVSQHKEMEEALRLGFEVVEGRRHTLGELHPETLEGLRDWSSVLQACGRYHEAEEAGRRALQGMEQVLGFDHPTTQQTLQQLAALYDGQGKGKEKDALLEEHKTKVVVEAPQAPKPRPLGPVILFVLSIYVEPRHRRAGVGRKLMKHWKDLAIECKAVSVDVRISEDSASRRFFTNSIGMTEVQPLPDSGNSGAGASVHLSYAV